MLGQLMARTVIEIKKNGSESSASVMRRFSRRVRESGIIRHVKDNRYNERQPSTYVMKKNALKRMEKRTEYAKLKKLGKIA
jgi:ribosomal protein S21